MRDERSRKLLITGVALISFLVLGLAALAGFLVRESSSMDNAEVQALVFPEPAGQDVAETFMREILTGRLHQLEAMRLDPEVRKHYLPSWDKAIRLLRSARGAKVIDRQRPWRWGSEYTNCTYVIELKDRRFLEVTVMISPGWNKVSIPPSVAELSPSEVTVRVH